MKCKENYSHKEDCIPFETPIRPRRLAQAYVPMQKICGYFDPVESLINGTIFPSLKQ